MEVPAPKFDVGSWLEAVAEPGDLVLTGCSDMTSRLIQAGTRGQVSHAAVVTRQATVVEAYDYGFTPLELDEGIYETPLREMGARATLDRVMVRRPIGFDGDKLESAIRFAIGNSPPFPTAGAVLMNLLIITGRPWPQRLFALANRVGLATAVDRVLDGLVDLVADGPERVHCSEIATRLYLAAGLELRFVNPLLLAHVDRVLASVRVGADTVRVDRRMRGKLASLDRHLSRRAQPGSRSAVVLDRGPMVAADSKIRAANEVQKMSLQAARTRLAEAADNESDLPDLIVPADFERAEPFTTVGLIVRRRGQWDDQGLILCRGPHV